MTQPGFDEDEEMREQEAVSILLLRVALRLLGEARLRGDFGGDESLAERAVAIADEITGGTASPQPGRVVVEASLIRPDRISLSAPFDSSSSTAWSLMLDGTLYGGMTVTGYGSVAAEEPEELSEEEQAERERLSAEWQVRMERSRQFTATRFVRAITPPSRPGSSRPILAVLLYDDGFYVESTYDKDAPTFDPEMEGRQFFAVLRGEEPAITVTDDVGTEYFESGGGGSGGVKVSHASLGFAPAPPATARVLRISTGDTTFELPLRG
ncbi:MAG: hypothetical protein ACRDPE_05165 [Solirubrobacterales bacterium]